MADWPAELFQLGPAGAAERRIGGLIFVIVSIHFRL